jgi:hypothetical protein
VQLQVEKLTSAGRRAGEKGVSRGTATKAGGGARRGGVPAVQREFD